MSHRWSIALLLLNGLIGFAFGPLHFGPGRLLMAQIAAFAVGLLALVVSAAVVFFLRARPQRLSVILLAPLVFLLAEVAGTIVYKRRVAHRLSAVVQGPTPAHVEVWPFAFNLIPSENDPDVVATYSNGGWYRFLIMTDGTVSIRD